jgi:hypothetical protein
MEKITDLSQVTDKGIIQDCFFMMFGVYCIVGYLMPLSNIGGGWSNTR